jgi:hypothetical protein
MKIDYVFEGKFKRTIRPLGNTDISFTSEIFEGELMDTEVKIDNQQDGYNLCVIAGNTIFDFYNELQNVINKYRI